jgi:hypothetical protein
MSCPNTTCVTGSWDLQGPLEIERRRFLSFEGSCIGDIRHPVAVKPGAERSLTLGLRTEPCDVDLIERAEPGFGGFCLCSFNHLGLQSLKHEVQCALTGELFAQSVEGPLAGWADASDRHVERR